MFAKMIVPAMLLALAFGATAHAQGTTGGGGGDVEFFHQAGAGASEVTGMLGYRSLTTKAKGGTTDSTISGITDTGVMYEYGINEMMSVSGSLGFSMLETNSNPKTKVSGLQDPMVMLRGTTPMEMGRLRWGAGVGLGFMKGKVETNGDMNAATGGFSLAPYVGYDMDMGPGVLGARLSYTLRMERTTDAGGTDVKTTGGDTLGLAVFYEYLLSDMVLGGDFHFNSSGDSKTKIGALPEVTSKGSSPMGIHAYARIPMMEGMSIIPTLGYDFAAGGDLYDKYSDLSLSVAARFGF